MTTRSAELRLVSKISNGLRVKLKSLKLELADATLPGRAKYEYLTWQLNDDAWAVLLVPMGRSFPSGSLVLSTYIGIRLHSLTELYSRYLNVRYSRADAHVSCGLHELTPAWARQIQVAASDCQGVIEDLAHQVSSVAIPALTRMASLHQILSVLQGKLKPWHGDRGYLLPLVHILFGDWTSAIATAKQEYEEAEANKLPYREAYSKFFARLVDDWSQQQKH